MAKIEVVSKIKGMLSAEVGQGVTVMWPAMGSMQKLSADEISFMVNAPGGRYVAENCVIIKDENLINELRIRVEPEYFFDEKDIKALITKGNIEQLEDALEYGGPGVRDLIKDVAISMDISDRNKVNAISDATGYDIQKLTENTKELEEDKGTKEKRSRKAKPFNPNEVDAPKRERQRFIPEPRVEEEVVEEVKEDKPKAKAKVIAPKYSRD